MNNRIKNILDKLSSLDLSTYPIDEIMSCFEQSGHICYSSISLTPEYEICRARQNETDESFYSKCQLTYKPSQFNNSYQRASTPNMTMFYGSFLSPLIEDNKLADIRFITAFETMPWLRDKSSKGIRKVTFSNWIVKKPIKLIAVIQCDKLNKKCNYSKKMISDYFNFLDKYPDVKEDSFAFTSFLANQFAKKIEFNDYEYLISSLFAQFAVKNGYDGVMYPSIKVDGLGFNIAITPEVADSKLDLNYVAECTGYKLGENTIFDNNYEAVLHPNQTDFIMKEIENKNMHVGKEECLRVLGLQSLD